jgi:type IV pili sensor histidine kinase/response regulator
MTLRDALEVLAGQAFHLVQDPVHRLITFERCAMDRVAVEDAAPTNEMQVAQDEN